MRAKIGKVREVVQSTIARGKVENVVQCNALPRFDISAQLLHASAPVRSSFALADKAPGRFF
ncbi:hypothetical protein GJW-30_1_03927 [Variibacter gotjawalensis]|uniref:Uncharacterized protein n=2 Tax=Variibacter gotjawalensis TaxID=1333996 RepID=A0A0S3PZK5_9BRAD|nr:hypothetical protein EV661_1533 [Variibacter gotjawalensis]BAT61370.1 hypothetical protein GJW-30_1_03927 [Variibacter gotjawalensis]